MSLVFLSFNGVKIAPFKYTDLEPFGAFANTTSVDFQGRGSYPIRQQVGIHGQFNIVDWPSAEHAYHGQKIIFLRNKLPANHPAQRSLQIMLNAILAVKEEFKPRNHYDGLVNSMLPELISHGLALKDKCAFDDLCEANYHSTKNPLGHKRSFDFMREVVRLKLAQHDNLHLLAMKCAQEGVLPVEVSQYDVNWASGPDGEGENLLGILIYEEGARLLKAQGGIPAFEDPAAQYAKLSRSSRKHDVLISNINPALASGWQKVSTKGLELKLGVIPLEEQNHESEYFLSQGGNQRLVIRQGIIEDFEYRTNDRSPWHISGDPSRFTGLIRAYQQQQRPNEEYFLSRGGNQRLVISQGEIVDYEYRIDDRFPWQSSGDHSRFEGLVYRATQEGRLRAVDQQINRPGETENPSNLNAHEINQITSLIEKLNKELKSCWPYPNKNRKMEKIHGLNALLENAKIMSIDKAIDKVERDYPELREGSISTRTADLLDEFRNERQAINYNL